MLKKIALGVAAVVAIFLIYVGFFQDSHYKVERSGVIPAPAEKVFPYLSNLKKGEEWSPFEKMDPTSKKNFVGTEGEVGSKLEFDGPKAGTGHVEILNLIPNELVEMRLTMTKPMAGESVVQYKLTPEGEGSRFTWSIEGENNFLGRLICTFANMDKMMGGHLEEGIHNLQSLFQGGEGSQDKAEKAPEGAKPGA